MGILGIIGLIISIGTALFLAKSAYGKVVGTQEAIGNFAYMKLEKHRVSVGVAEMVAAVLLVIPATSLYGAFLIASIMSGAAAIHLTMFGGKDTKVPVLVGLAAVIGYILTTIQ